MLGRFHLIPERYGRTDRQTVRQTDRQTDGQICYINMYFIGVSGLRVLPLLINGWMDGISRVSMLTRDKNEW